MLSSLLSLTQVQPVFDTNQDHLPRVGHCPEWAEPSNINQQSRLFFKEMATGQLDVGHTSVETSSFQVTLCSAELSVKMNQHTCLLS